MFRGIVGSMAVMLALMATCVAVAQDGVNIVVAGEIVARVREAGSYQSVQARADAIHQAIAAAMVGQNPATVEVSLKQVNGQWTVFIAGKPVMAVLPAEAEANGMAPHVLGSIWVEKLKKALVNYTPTPTTTTTTVIDLTSPLEAEPATGAPPSSSTTTTTATASAAAASGTEVIEIPLGPTTPTAPASSGPGTSVAAAQGARLLIVDAFNKVRALPEDEYLRTRQTRASELLDDLLRVISSGASGLPEEPAIGEPRPGVGTITVAPPSTVEEIPVGPTAPASGATQPTPPPPPTGGTTITGSPASEAAVRAGVPENDPSYARVPQKRRISKKFEAAQRPYLQLKATDPASAEQVNELLKAARREYAAGNFDVAEEYLDGALRMLGVTQW